ncbi:hypothetical protein GCM10009613_16880 [Pseudonocardia kongjuensis]|uniref:Uncharacterized protein n=1 Tax=Pseudonocardia kongjuensis TaxID=102227 RepID=A0ABN1XN57_9PSEU
MARVLRAVLPLLVLAAAAAVLWMVLGAGTPVEWIDRGEDVVWVVAALVLIPLATAVLAVYDEWAAARRNRAEPDRRVARPGRDLTAV